MLSGNFAEITTSTPFRDLLHAANLRHGTDGFTSPTKEGVLRIFLPLKIRQLQPGLNPRSWVPKNSTLPMDHQSRMFSYIAKDFHIKILHSPANLLINAQVQPITILFHDHVQSNLHSYFFLVVFFLLGESPTSEIYVLTFHNTPSVPSS
jgi:hypothetical protein